MIYYVACLLLGMAVAEAMMFHDICSQRVRLEELKDEIKRDKAMMNNLRFLVDKVFVELTLGEDDKK